jgi:cell division protein FtsL
MAAYVYGNVVRKEKTVAPNVTREPKEVSQQVRKNRSKATHMNKGYVIFLAVAAMVALFACVKYLQLQSEITSRSKQITSMQQDLADAKEANTTKYNAIMNTMNLEEIRDIAIREYGMVYAEDDQIIKYKSPTGSAVTQFVGIPKSGIVASSDEVE